MIMRSGRKKTVYGGRGRSGSGGGLEEGGEVGVAEDEEEVKMKVEM